MCTYLLYSPTQRCLTGLVGRSTHNVCEVEALSFFSLSAPVPISFDLLIRVRIRTCQAAVVGDTVGDPLKDTSGPSLNILMKLMAIISLVFAEYFQAINDGQGVFKIPS